MKKRVEKGIKRVGMLVAMAVVMMTMGMEAKAAGKTFNLSELKINDIITKDDTIYNDEMVTYIFKLYGKEIFSLNAGESKKLSEVTGLTEQKYRITSGGVIGGAGGNVIDIEPVVEEPGTGGGSGDSGDSGDTESASSSGDGMTAEEREAYEREQWEKAWKVSVSNPDNYLPKVGLADGSEVQSTVPSHYTEKKDSSVAVLLTTQAQRDFHAALGITGNGYAHMNAYQSQCGPKMRELFDTYAKSLGALLGNDMTIGDIIELQMEVREKDTYKLLDTVAESSTPIELMVALKGDLLEKAEAGNELVLLCYADGELSYYTDTDLEASTLTVSTTKTSGIFAIAYAPKGTFTETK